VAEPQISTQLKHEGAKTQRHQVLFVTSRLCALVFDKMQTYKLAFAKWVVLFSGAINLLTGAALLFAPAWFYNVVADFPPFNRHFLGDAGAFIFALGLGLLFAAREPKKHRGLIGVAALGTLLHVGNHLYDDLIVEHAATAHWLTNTLPLAAMAVLLIAAYIFLTRSD
jgi:predicted anti-sigma-YlaC factor YlaD